MNIGVIACMIMAVLFFILSTIFALLKEKGAMLISGFNSIPKEEWKRYDTLKMSKDMSNRLFSWGGLFVMAGILSYFASQYIAIIAFIIWLFIFFKEVHFDTEKAFGKYKL